MPAGVRATRPRFFVEDEEQQKLADGLLELAIHDSWEGLCSTEATFGNWGDREGTTSFLYSGRELLDFGKRLEIRLGEDVVFKGLIMGLRGEYAEGLPPGLTVLAEDRLQDLRMVRRSRSFADMSDSDVISQVAREHGLQSDTDLDGAVFVHLAQLNQSDLAFLRERGRIAGFDVWLDDRTLHASARSARAGEAVTLARGSDLAEFFVTADLAGQSTRVRVTGWDVACKEAIEEEADEATLGAEIGDGESGARLLDAARGARVETLVHALPTDSAEARSRAEAFFRARARRFVTGEGRAQGDARLKVGRSVALTGFGPTFDGTYTLVRVVHRFDATSGLQSHIEVERPAVGRKS